MKYLIVLLLAGCYAKQTSAPSSAPIPAAIASPVIVDTCIGKPAIHDTVIIEKIVKVPAACAHQKTIDSLRSKLFLANYRVERVRYYLKIAIRNPSQDKFLKSWISRAVK